GILGHDIRNPLAAITLLAKVARAKPPTPSELNQHLTQIITSADAIGALVTDLIDFTSATIGSGVPLIPVRADLHVVCGEVLRETQAAHPGRTMRLSVQGDLMGTWDDHRLRQVIS